MSQENVEVVRSLYPPDGIEMVGLTKDLEAVKREYGPLLHPDFEVSVDPEQPGPVVGQTGRGIEGFVRGWQDWSSAFETYRVIPKEFVALPHGRVLVLVENRATSRRDGVEMAFEGGAIWTLEDGLVRKIEQFVDRHRALEAAGLAE